ncbi:hypothetical protein D3C83_302470 [compost metagenome]
MLNGHLVAYGPVAQTLTNEVLQTAYGAHLHFIEGETAKHVQVLEDVHHHAEELNPPSHPHV